MKRNEVENIIEQIEVLSTSFQDVLSRELIGEDGRLEKLSSITFKIFGQDVEKLGQQMRMFLKDNFDDRDPEQDRAMRKALGIENIEQ